MCIPKRVSTGVSWHFERSLKNFWGLKSTCAHVPPFFFLNFDHHLPITRATFPIQNHSMSTLPMTPGAGPSCPSHPRPQPVIAIPTQPCAEEEDPEIVALTKKISALREKRAREEEERRRREEEEKKVRREELEQARAVEARWRAAEIAKEQGVGRKRSPSLETEGDRAECARCRRLGLACVWPSGGQGTACNACAGAKQKCGGGEVERPERPEKKKARVTWMKRSAESEEEQLEMWVLQALWAEVEFMNVVWATHNLVMRRVAELG